MHMSKQTNIRETLPDIRTLYWFQVYNTDQVRAYYFNGPPITACLGLEGTRSFICPSANTLTYEPHDLYSYCYLGMYCIGTVVYSYIYGFTVELSAT